MADSFLSDKIQGYLEFRRGLGYRAIQDRFELNLFEREIGRRGIRDLAQIDSGFILELARQQLETKRARTVNGHLGILRNFFQYLQRIHACDSNPLSEHEGFRNPYFVPYVFSDAEVTRILQGFARDTAASRHWKHFMPRLSRHCAFTLIAHCGLRISEACRLRLEDVDRLGGTILIEKTKFRKDRRIPISASVMRELVNYAEIRKHHLRGERSSHLFISEAGTGYSRKTLGHFFRLKVNELGIYRAPWIRGNTIFGSPSPHSLRHSFAVRTVRRWQALHLPIDSICDTLATYMGHVDIRFTLVYLKALSLDPGHLIFKPTHGL